MASHTSYGLTVLCSIAVSAFAQIPSSYYFTIYDVPGATSTQINSINDRGDIVGTYTTPDLAGHVFVRLAGSFTVTTITSPDGNPAGTPVINSQGQIAFQSGTNIPGFGSSFATSTIYLRSADGRQNR